MNSWRLVPAAIAAWMCALAVLLCVGISEDPNVRRTVALVSIGIAAISLLAGAALLVKVRTRPAGVTLMVAGAAAVSAGVYCTSLVAAPLADAAVRGSRVTMTAVIAGDMRVRQGFTAGMRPGEETLEARAQAREISIAGDTWQIDLPVQLRLAADARPVIGSTIEVTGRLMSAQPARGVAAIVLVSQWHEVASPGLIAAGADAVRQGLRDAVAGSDPRAASLVEGLAVGDELGQPPGLADDMRISGLSHLTAVSGGNTALVIGAVLLVAGLAGLSIGARAIVAALALIGYVIVVGAQPSVLRAAAMGVVAIIALVVGGPRRGLPTLAGVVALLVIASPALAASWGFALSVSATAGLLVLAPSFVRRFRGEGEDRPARVRRALAEALALTVAAQIATAPIIAAFGNGISIVAVPANLIVEPVVGPVTVLGLLAAITAPVAPPIGALLGHLAIPMAAWISYVAEVSAQLPIATLPWPGGLGGAALATVAMGAAIWWVRRIRGQHERRYPVRTAVMLTIALAGATILVLRLPDRAGWPPPGWRIVACDVGQGDALVLHVNDSSAVVVDAGPDPDLVDRCLADLGVAHVPLLVLTHPHADHVEGVPGVLRGREVDAVLVSPLREPIDEAERVDEWTAGMVIHAASVGEHLDIDDVHLTVLWPQRIIRGSGSAPNNASVVLLADVSGVRTLLLGDVETAAQVALRSAFTVQGVDVVKVAHHGSRLQDPVLPAWSGGRIALISVGEGNDYGHPAPETLQAWSAVGAVIGRTDQAGDVAVVQGEDGGLGIMTRRTAQ